MKRMEQVWGVDSRQCSWQLSAAFDEATEGAPAVPQRTASATANHYVYSRTVSIKFIESANRYGLAQAMRLELTYFSSITKSNLEKRTAIPDHRIEPNIEIESLICSVKHFSNIGGPQLGYSYCEPRVAQDFVSSTISFTKGWTDTRYTCSSNLLSNHSF